MTKASIISMIKTQPPKQTGALGAALLAKINRP